MKVFLWNWTPSVVHHITSLTGQSQKKHQGIHAVPRAKQRLVSSCSEAKWCDASSLHGKKTGGKKSCEKIWTSAFKLQEFLLYGTWLHLFFPSSQSLDEQPWMEKKIASVKYSGSGEDSPVGQQWKYGMAGHTLRKPAVVKAPDVTAILAAVCSVRFEEYCYKVCKPVESDDFLFPTTAQCKL